MTTINAVNGVIAAKVIKHGTSYADSPTQQVLLAIPGEEDDLGMIGDDVIGWHKFSKAKLPEKLTTLNVPCVRAIRTLNKWTTEEGVEMESPFLAFER